MIELKLNRLVLIAGLGDFNDLMANSTDDEASSLVFQICNQLENLSVAEFVVSGFGQPRWPVNIRTDLVVVLEQLWTICERFESDDYTFSLDFYEQGIERYLSFREYDKLLVEVTCKSLTKWCPEPEIEYISKVELNTMIFSLVSAFKEISESVFPELVRNGFFQSLFKPLQQNQKHPL